MKFEYLSSELRDLIHMQILELIYSNFIVMYVLRKLRPDCSFEIGQVKVKC